MNTQSRPDSEASIALPPNDDRAEPTIAYLRR